MQKVVINTNVIISAALSSNNSNYSAQIIELIEDKKICPYYTSEVLEEYKNVLSREKYDIPVNVQEEILDSIKSFGVLVEVETNCVRVRDEKDQVFYDVARAQRAALITNDNDLLVLYDEYSMPPVIQPCEYLEQYSKIEEKMRMWNELYQNQEQNFDMDI